MTEKTDKKRRLLELDALRGIAAVGVMLFHYSVIYYKLFPSMTHPLFQFRYGRLSVHLFFIISGFVIFMTLEKTRRPTDFIVSRFSRLFSTYWFSISPWLMLIIPTTVSILAATFINRWIERPSLEFIRGWYRQKSSSKITAAEPAFQQPIT